MLRRMFRPLLAATLALLLAAAPAQPLTFPKAQAVRRPNRK
jgi:hypothetical protein